jgi:branched-chain amino acid transport system ATP-binding protein
MKGQRESRRYVLDRARTILEVSNVSKRFGGVVALDEASFDLKEGEILGVIGPNGAGKTTLFDVIGGQQTADAGRVAFDGEEITNLPASTLASKKLIRRFQDARLFPSLTVYENILMALDQKLETRNMVFVALQLPQVRRAERRVRVRADRLIELLRLEGYQDKFVKELSTGLRRIVDLACVLATEPKLLLLDEPSTGIAQAESESLGPLLRRIRFETGCSMLVIEHDMNLISNIADELLAMHQGQVIARGAPEEILNNELVINSYLGTTEATIRRSGVIA